MKTKALRLYGKNDLRLEEFELPLLGDFELLVKIVSDSLCMSSYKAASIGAEHKRVPDDVAENPTVTGHELCGEIIALGTRVEEKYPNRYKVGAKFSLQPAMKGVSDAIGYSFRYIGGCMQYGIIPECYLTHDCILLYNGEAYFCGSLAEPYSCVIGASHSNYHIVRGEYKHIMDIIKGGKMAVLGGAGPMGLAITDYTLHREHSPSLLVITDINVSRLKRAAEILPQDDAAKNDIELVYLDANIENPASALMSISGGEGFDDVFVFAPDAELVEQGDAILAQDGCLHFFAGPTDTAFSARLNLYNVHYKPTHVAGISGGNTDDMREALSLIAKGRLNPAVMVTHIGGLDAAREATLRLPEIGGGKKLIYTLISLPLTAISDFAQLGKTDPLFMRLNEICAAHGGLWNTEAEQYLLTNAKKS